jgi:hypothetical protein
MARTTSVFAFVILTVLPAAGQKTWTMPRTPDGQPDLQGIWNNATLTPMERPAQYAGKATLTEKEAAEFEKEELGNVNADRRDGSRVTDVNRAYNEFWRDRGKITPDRRTSLIIDPPDGRVPPLTPAAQKRAADLAAQNQGHEFDGPENRSLAERCIAVPNAGPPMMPANYNANYQIVQSRGYVALLSEQIHDVRIIPTDGRPHIPKSIHQWYGDSVGHWEGNTLVIDTTNFTDQTPFKAAQNLHVVERLTRADEDTILYQFTVEDPGMWTKPWSGELPIAKIDGQLYEYACHEANYPLANTLRGARVAEAEAAKKSAK